MTIGDTIFVRWYGKIVEGMIVENNEVTPALASMVVVRIPVQGVRASALFTPDHVYPSAELAGMKEHIKVVPTVVPTSEVTTDSNESELWSKLQEFKLANWDNEHNHIEVSALNDFYDLWVDYMTQRLNATQSKEYKNKMAIEASKTTDNPYVVLFKSWEGPVKPEPVGKTISKAIASAKRALKKVSKNPTVTQLSLFD